MSLPLAFVVRPPNDDFAWADLLSGESDVRRLNTVNATLESGEPDAGTGLGHTVWYGWRAPADGVVSLITESTGGSTVSPQVFTGTALSSLRRPRVIDVDATSQPNQDRPQPELTRDILLFVEQGSDYAIQIDSRQGTNRTDPSIARFRGEFIPAPINDAQTNAIPVEGESARAAGTLRGARGESAGPTQVRAASTPMGIGSRAVWYRWTAPQTSRMTLVTTAPSGVSVHLFVEAGFGDATRPATTSSPVLLGEVQVFAGRSYLVAVTQRDTLPGMDFEWRLFPAVAPANDLFADRRPITGASATFEAHHERATLEAGETLARSVWWTWTAPATGWATLRGPSGTGFMVGTGDTWPGLVAVPLQTYSIGSNRGPPIPLTGFECVAGTTYQIAAGRPQGATPFVYDITLDGYHGGAVQADVELVYQDRAVTRISNIERLPPGLLRLHLQGPDGAAFGLERSETLTQWTEVATGRFGTGEPWRDIALGVEHGTAFFRLREY